MEPRQTKRQKLNDTLGMINDPSHCHCGILAKSFKVKKEGPNKGRDFFTCGANGKCRFFKWGDDYTRILALSKYHPDEKFIIQMEIQRRLTERFLPVYPILKHPGERASLFCVEKGREPLIKKLVETVYEGEEIYYTETLEALDYHIDFRYKSNKIYCAFAKTNWSDETEKRLRDLHERGVIKYEEVVSKINYTKQEVDYDRLWIQLHGVEKNKRGWLIDGMADFIIFELGPNQYKHVKREKLKRYILENCVGIRSLYQNQSQIDGITLHAQNGETMIPYTAHLKVYAPRSQNRSDAYCYITQDELSKLDK